MPTTLTKKPQIVFKEEEDGAFLFDPENGNLKYINRTGKDLFLLLENHSDTKELVDILVQRYPETDPHRLKDDVTEFVNELKVGGFIAFEEHH